MLPLKSLTNLADGAKFNLAALKAMNDKINNKIDALNADTSRSQSYKTDTIKAMRDEAMPAVMKIVDEMTEANEVAKEHKEFWSDRALLLSSIAFDPDQAKDAVIRMSYAGELSAMDLRLLTLTQKNAIADNNLPLVWACTVAAHRAGHGDLINISKVKIPQQDQALALIASCDASLAEAEMTKGGMFGATVDPMRKLEFARRMQPDRPITHNSPGRPAP
ncbi:MAG: hypothetical protein WA190_17695 [Usitatibacter sp.]